MKGRKGSFYPRNTPPAGPDRIRDKESPFEKPRRVFNKYSVDNKKKICIEGIRTKYWANRTHARLFYGRPAQILRARRLVCGELWFIT